MPHAPPLPLQPSTRQNRRTRLLSPIQVGRRGGSHRIVGFTLFLLLLSHLRVSILPVRYASNDSDPGANDNGGSDEARIRDGKGMIGVEAESVGDEGACTIRDLDNGKDFVVNEVKEDGTWKKRREVGSRRNLSMEEIEMSEGNSLIVQELMSRKNADSISNSNSKLNLYLNSNSNYANGEGDDDGLKVNKGD